MPNLWTDGHSTLQLRNLKPDISYILNTLVKKLKIGLILNNFQVTNLLSVPMFGKICRNGNMLTLDVQNPPKFEVKLDLDSIGSSLGIDRELI